MSDDDTSGMGKEELRALHQEEYRALQQKHLEERADLDKQRADLDKQKVDLNARHRDEKGNQIRLHQEEKDAQRREAREGVERCRRLEESLKLGRSF